MLKILRKLLQVNPEKRINLDNEEIFQNSNNIDFSVILIGII